MKKILIYLVMILFVSSCGLLFKAKDSIEPEHTNFFMITMIEKTFTYSQLDSLCNADMISSAPAGWTKMYFINGETGEPIEQYLYIKESGDTTFTYTALPSGENVFVTKRMQYEN